MGINETIRQMREKQGWTQEIMAEKMNMSVNGYANLERGQGKVDWEKLKQLAEIFNINLVQLVEAEQKGLVVHQTLSFQSENINASGNYQKNYSNHKDLIFELEKHELTISYLKELLNQKDDEIKVLKELVSSLQNQLNNQ